MMLKTLHTVADIIDALGGPTATGRLVDMPGAAACNWRNPDRGPSKIPPKYYWTIKCALSDRGYDASLDCFGFHGTFQKSA